MHTQLSKIKLLFKNNMHTIIKNHNFNPKTCYLTKLTIYLPHLKKKKIKKKKKEMKRTQPITLLLKIDGHRGRRDLPLASFYGSSLFLAFFKLPC